MSPRDLSDVIRIEIGGGIVSVWHARPARDLEELAAILSAIDAALERTSIGLLMFDSRDSDRTPPEIQQGIWAWLSKSSRLVKVATVMKSELLGVSVRMTGLSQGVRIRAFPSPEAARAWLLEP